MVANYVERVALCALNYFSFHDLMLRLLFAETFYISLLDTSSSSTTT